MSEQNRRTLEGYDDAVMAYVDGARLYMPEPQRAWLGDETFAKREVEL